MLFRNHPELADHGYRWIATHRVALGRLTGWLPDFYSR
jgi:hypothetical protein